MNALTTLQQPKGRVSPAVSRAGGLLETLDLRALRYFAAAARHGSLARAALQLNVTASAISQQLRKLEDELGTTLLIRHGRGVSATPAGACLLERIDVILRLLRTLDAPDSGAVPADGAVSLALPAELAAMLAAPLAAQVRQAWPAVTLEFKEVTDCGTDALLLRGQVDIAVVQDPPELEALQVDRVATEALGLVVAPQARLAQASLPLRLRELALVPLILPGEQHWLRRLLAKAAFQHGVGLDVAFQADGLSMTRHMVRQGLGAAVLPHAAVREETARGALVFRLLTQPALTVTHAVAVQSTAAPVVRAIAGAAAAAMRALVASGDWTGAALVPARQIVTNTEQTRAATWQLPRSEPSGVNLEFAEGD